MVLAQLQAVSTFSWILAEIKIMLKAFAFENGNGGLFAIVTEAYSLISGWTILIYMYSATKWVFLFLG